MKKVLTNATNGNLDSVVETSVTQNVNENSNKDLVSKVDIQNVSLSTEDIDKITIHPLLETIRTQNKTEYEALENSIISLGMNVPILITKDLVCLDGRARLKIYKMHKEVVKPIFKIIDCNEAEMVEILLQVNLINRNFTKGQKAITIAKVYLFAIEQRKTKQDFTLQGLDINSFDKSRELFAKVYGISSTYISYANYILQNAPELIGAIELGTIAIYKAYKQASGNSNSEIHGISYDTPSHIESTESGSRLRKTDPKQSLNSSSPDDKLSLSTKDDGNDQNSKPQPPILPIDNFEYQYRKLKSIENEVIRFLKEDLNFSKADDLICKILTKEEVEIASINGSRTEDEKFDLLCDYFIDTYKFESVNDFELLHFGNVFENIKKLRIENEIMSFDSQVLELRKLLNESENSILDLTFNRYRAEKQNELNIEETLVGKIYKFVEKCNTIFGKNEIKEEVIL